MSGYNVSALGGPSAARPAAPGFTRLLIGAFDELYAWQERFRGRNALAEMDARMLKDIGLTPSDVASEVDKPFWLR